MTFRLTPGAAAVAGGLLLFAAPRAAIAQPPPHTPALDAATDRFEAGKRLFREGKREHNQSKIERAYFEFKAAYAIYPGRGTLLNLTEAELATERPLDAMKHVREYVRNYGVPEEGSEYRRTFDADQAAAFRATGHIVLVGPASMRVLVDGHDEGLITPVAEAVDVSAGHHAVELVGTETLRGEVEAPAGSTTKLEFSVATAGPIASPSPVNPIPIDPRPPGAEGALPSMPERPRDASGSYWSATHVAGAVLSSLGVVALGTGVVFAVLANQDGDRANAISTALGPSGCSGSGTQGCRDLQAAHDDQARDHALNVVLVSVGAVAAVTGATMLLIPSRARSTAFTLAPTLSARSAGLQIQGEFR